MASNPSRAPNMADVGGTSRLNLTLAVSEYEHMRDLTAGLVQPQGIQLTVLTLPIEEIAFRHFKNLEFDIAETSFAKYIGTVALGDAQIVGIPVFPARVFRFSSLYIRKDSGIRAPKDFEGRTVGIPEWAQTAGVYVRGLLSEYFDVALDRIDWVQASVNEPGRIEKVKLNLPPAIRYRSRPDKSLNEMLLSGEIDAAFSARPPESFLAGDPRIERLFPDFRAREEKYFDDTGIFPILHIMSLRRSILETHPWVAMNMLHAFEVSKDNSVRRLREITTSRIPLPWGVAHADSIAAKMGGDIWPYRVGPNLKTLQAFCRFAHDQHLTPRLMTVDDLFPKEVMESYRV